MVDDNREKISPLLYLIVVGLVLVIACLMYFNFHGSKWLKPWLGSIFQRGVTQSSNNVPVFSMPGWKNPYSYSAAGGKTATFVNNYPDKFMLVIANEAADSFLKIVDNSEISVRFFLGEVVLRKENMGNNRLAVRLYSSSARDGGLNSGVYTELAVVKEYYFKRNSIEVVEKNAKLETKTQELEIKIPFDVRNFEVKIVPQKEGKTNIVVLDPTTGIQFGSEVVDMALFPDGNYLNTKVELGNKIEKINLDDFTVSCTKCTK